MAKSRPPKVHCYSMHFKATAVRLSELPDVPDPGYHRGTGHPPLMLNSTLALDYS